MDRAVFARRDAARQRKRVSGDGVENDVLSLVFSVFVSQMKVAKDPLAYKLSD